MSRLLERKLRDACIAGAVLALLACSVLAPAAENLPRWTVESIVKQLDHAAAEFRTLAAEIEHTKFTEVVKDTSVETGQILVRHDHKMRIDIQKPDARTILRSGDQLFIFTPKINRVEEYNLGKNRAMVDQYLLLGFGTKGEELKKNYLLTVLGEETLDNRNAVLVEMTPKSEKIRRQISKIQMWIDEASWIPVQQKFFETGGDYFLVHYKNVALNTKIADAKFKADWPKNASRIKPRG